VGLGCNGVTKASLASSATATISGARTAAARWAHSVSALPVGQRTPLGWANRNSDEAPPCTLCAAARMRRGRASGANPLGIKVSWFAVLERRSALHDQTQRINRAKPLKWVATAPRVNAITARHGLRAQERTG